MAGILGYDPTMIQGGILGAVAPQMASWQQPVGMFGAALRDAGAYLSGHPADATAVQQYGQDLRRYQAQQGAMQAVQAAQSNDPATSQQGYAAMVALGLDPTPIQKLKANAALPQLMQNLQPSMGFNDNPVGVTPAVNAGPGALPQRQAAQALNAAPAMSMQPSTLSGALQRTGSPELTAEMAPQMIQSQIASQQKIADAKALGQLDAYTPIAQGDPAYAGYRKGTILGRNQLGDIKPLQQSDVMSPEAEAQRERIARVERSAAIEAQMRMYGLGGGQDPTQNAVVQSYRDNILSGNSNLQNVPMPLRGAVSMALQGVGKDQYTPTSSRKYTLAASAITKPYTEQSGYKLTADAVPYLKRIDAAMKTPGSVSDQDLLDSLTKLNTGGNAVTDAQVSLITHGKSLSDWAGVMKNKLGNGGVLSDAQRQEIHQIAGNIYQGYRETYQPIYDQASAQLSAAGIPKAFWTIPDLNAIGDAQMAAGKPAPAKSPLPSPANLPRKNKTIRFEDLP